MAAAPNEFAKCVVVVSWDASDTTSVWWWHVQAWGIGALFVLEVCSPHVQTIHSQAIKRKTAVSLRVLSTRSSPWRSPEGLGWWSLWIIKRSGGSWWRGPPSKNNKRRLFLYCLQHALVLLPAWQPRTSSNLLTNRRDWSASPSLFWRANGIAARLWGCGFTYDRFASTQQVQPFDCPWKLPFASRYHQAYSSGVNVLGLRWNCDVNAPFSLIGKQSIHSDACARGRRRLDCS